MAEESIYNIRSTNPNEPPIIVQPRTVNGPGNALHSTDITMYGNAATEWGEKFNENFYHLLENFACSSRLGYGGSIHEPATETDFLSPTGTGGINNPVNGQLWYNTDNNRLYIFDGTTWDFAHHGIEVDDIIGMDTFETDVANNLASGLATKLSLDGSDTMAGELKMGTQNITMAGGTLNITTGGINVSSANIIITSGSLVLNGVSQSINMNSGRITNVGNATAGTDAITWNVGDSRYIKLDGSNSASQGLITATNGITIPYGERINFGSDSNDPGFIYKYAQAIDQEDLRVVLSDNPSSAVDRLVVGAESGGTFTESLAIDTAGNVFSTWWNIQRLGLEHVTLKNTELGGNLSFDATASFAPAGSTGLRVYTGGGNVQGQVLYNGTLKLQAIATGIHVPETVTADGTPINNNHLVRKIDLDNAIQGVNDNIAASGIYWAPSTVGTVVYNFANSANSSDTTELLDYTAAGVPTNADRVLVRFSTQISAITDLRHYRVFMDGISPVNSGQDHLIHAMASDDTDQSGLQTAAAVTEVWVPRSWGVVRILYGTGGSGSVTTRIAVMGWHVS